MQVDIQGVLNTLSQEIAKLKLENAIQLEQIKALQAQVQLETEEAGKNG